MDEDLPLSTTDALVPAKTMEDSSCIVGDLTLFRLKKEEESCRTQLSPYLNGGDVDFVYKYKSCKLGQTQSSRLPEPDGHLPVSLTSVLFNFFPFQLIFNKKRLIGKSAMHFHRPGLNEVLEYIPEAHVTPSLFLQPSC